VVALATLVFAGGHLVGVRKRRGDAMLCGPTSVAKAEVLRAAKSRIGVWKSMFWAVSIARRIEDDRYKGYLKRVLLEKDD